MSMKCSPTEVSGNYLLMEVVYRIKNTLACPNCDGFAEYCIGFGKSRNSDFYSVFWKSCVGNVGGVWVFADRNNESPVIPMERIEPQRHQLYNWFRTKSFTLLAHTNCEGYLKWGRAWNVALGRFEQAFRAFSWTIVLMATLFKPTWHNLCWVLGGLSLGTAVPLKFFICLCVCLQARLVWCHF